MLPDIFILVNKDFHIGAGPGGKGPWRPGQGHADHSLQDLILEQTKKVLSSQPHPETFAQAQPQRGV